MCAIHLPRNFSFPYQFFVYICLFVYLIFFKTRLGVVQGAGKEAEYLVKFCLVLSILNVNTFLSNKFTYN